MKNAITQSFRDGIQMSGERLPRTAPQQHPAGLRAVQVSSDSEEVLDRLQKCREWYDTPTREGNALTGHVDANILRHVAAKAERCSGWAGRFSWVKLQIEKS